MRKGDIDVVALKEMCEIETLLLARKQAIWQKFRAPGEHKGKWFLVIETLDARIASLERSVKNRLEIGEYKTKREVRP